MGIYIEGLEMPKEGQLLYIDIYPDGKVARDFDLECKQIAIAYQVPAHGRLVDADAAVSLLKSLGNREYRRESGTIQDAIKMLSSEEYTPTIITAEEVAADGR